jgi:hypothetical protein
MLHITEPSSDCVIILDHNNTETDMSIVFAHHYGNGSNGAHYWGVGVDGSENDFVIGYDASSQASMGADQLLTIQHDGDVNVKSGDLIFGTSGKGVVLGATSNTAANTLDDYEEGTYAVTVSGSTSGTFTMATENTLAYTKVGRLVTVQGQIGVQSGSVSGNLRLSLPFAPTSLAEDAHSAFSSVMIKNTGNTNAGQTFLFFQTNGYAFFNKVADDGTFAYITNSDVDGNFEIGVSFTYISG